MVLTSFLHKILFTFTSIDRTSLNPGGIEARMLANAIGEIFMLRRYMDMFFHY